MPTVIEISFELLSQPRMTTFNTLFIFANQSNDNNIADLSSLQSIQLEIEVWAKFMLRSLLSSLFYLGLRFAETCLGQVVVLYIQCTQSKLIILHLTVECQYSYVALSNTGFISPIPISKQYSTNTIPIPIQYQLILMIQFYFSWLYDYFLTQFCV